MGTFLVVIGVALMLLGGIVLIAWVSGYRRLFDPSVYDRQGDSKADRQMLDLYFAALVIAPLLGGGILLVIGLSRLQ